MKFLGFDLVAQIIEKTQNTKKKDLLPERRVRVIRPEIVVHSDSLDNKLNKNADEQDDLQEFIDKSLNKEKD